MRNLGSEEWVGGLMFCRASPFRDRGFALNSAFTAHWPRIMFRKCGNGKRERWSQKVQAPFLGGQVAQA